MNNIIDKVIKEFVSKKSSTSPSNTSIPQVPSLKHVGKSNDYAPPHVSKRNPSLSKYKAAYLPSEPKPVLYDAYANVMNEKDPETPPAPYNSRLDKKVKPTKSFPPSTDFSRPETSLPQPPPPPPPPPPGFPRPPRCFPRPPTGFPRPPRGFPEPPRGFQKPSTGFPRSPRGFSGPPRGFPGPPRGFPGPPRGFPGPPRGFPGPPSSYPRPLMEDFPPQPDSDEVNDTYPPEHMSNTDEKMDADPYSFKRKYDLDIKGKVDQSIKFKKKKLTPDYVKDLPYFSDLPKELADLMKPNICNLCHITLPLHNQMYLHYTGKNHMSKLSINMRKNVTAPVASDIEMSETFCGLCNVAFSGSASANQHYSGKKHGRMIATCSDATFKTPKVDEEAPKDSNKKTESEIVEKTRLHCNICNVTSLTEDAFEIHLQGKRHIKAFRASQMVDPTDIQSIALSSHGDIGNAVEKVDPEILEEYDVGLYCLGCKKYYETKAEHSYHKCVDDEVDFTCNKCTISFETKCELKYHDCRQDHYCQTCEKTFLNPTDIPGHKCVKVQKSPAVDLQKAFYCTLCDKLLNSVIGKDCHAKSKLHIALLYRLQQYHGSSSYLDFDPFTTMSSNFECKVCNIRLISEKQLEDHLISNQHQLIVARKQLQAEKEEKQKEMEEKERKEEKEKEEKEKNDKVNAASSYKAVPPPSVASYPPPPLVYNTGDLASSYDIRNINIEALLAKRTG